MVFKKKLAHARARDRPTKQKMMRSQTMTASKDKDGYCHNLLVEGKRKYCYYTIQYTYQKLSSRNRDVGVDPRSSVAGGIDSIASLASLSEIHCTMGKGKKMLPSRMKNIFYFHGLLWLVALSFLPVAFAQPPTAAPTPGATTAPQVPAPTAPPPTQQQQQPTIPTISPTKAVPPTVRPTESSRPSFSPTASQQPTWSPTTQPTITPRPTGQPSINPTDYPSVQPSAAPTAEPTFANEIFARTVFNQRFQIGNEREFNETEMIWFCNNMEGYTDDFGGRDDERVNTTCRIISQRLQIIGGSRQLRDGLHSNDEIRRHLQGVVFNQVEYGMSYRSNHTNVTLYPTLFQNYVNEDLDRLTTDLQNAGLAVTNSFLAFNNIATEAPTTIPTMTPYPTATPSTGVPVATPSPVFTRDPATPDETAVPTSDGSPTLAPQARSGTKRSTVITASVIAALFTVMVGLFVFYRRRKRSNERKFQEQAAAAGTSTTVTGATGYMSSTSRNDIHVDTGQHYDDFGKNGRPETVGMISPADSLVSNGSLLSTGPSPLSEGSEREDDGTHNLADEFDQYKDQNLEKMRTGVEDNVSGVDGMMSQALTKAIMGDDDSEVIDMNELRWGGSGDSIEIEATALYEVTDWLKRKEGATTEER